MNRCGVPCGLEAQRLDGTWERLRGRPIQASTVTRPAEHDWEHIPPVYLRCRWCGAVSRGIRVEVDA